MVVIFLIFIRLRPCNEPKSVTPKPDGFRAPGEKTPQGLRTRANKATKLRIYLVI